MALSAVGLIFENLPTAYKHGKNLVAREKMALASTYAGLAFTRANVGYVHAIAHQFGGLYHTPHGLANAIMLPPVLRFSSEHIQAKLAVLAVRAGLGRKNEPEAKLAQKFLDSVEAMNRLLGIPKHLDALREKDIRVLAKAACWEADTNYPVPRAMSQRHCEALLREVLPAMARPGKVAAKKPATAKVPVRKAAARETPARKAPPRKAAVRRRGGAAA
jgi:alcohol dehydrogenase class IV